MVSGSWYVIPIAFPCSPGSELPETIVWNKRSPVHGKPPDNTNHGRFFGSAVMTIQGKKKMAVVPNNEYQVYIFDHGTSQANLAISPANTEQNMWTSVNVTNVPSSPSTTDRAPGGIAVAHSHVIVVRGHVQQTITMNIATGLPFFKIASHRTVLIFISRHYWHWR